MTYSVSIHAQKRYAERIQDKDKLVEVNNYVNLHQQKIIENINKMIEHGTLLFEGKQFNGYNNVSQIYLKDTWVLIVDPAKNTVVTLYSIDLGLGSEYNKEYISKMLELIDKEKENVKKSEEDRQTQKKTYEELIEENTGLISEYTTNIKSLKTLNDDYQKFIEDMDESKIVAETELRRLLGKLIGKKSF